MASFTEILIEIGSNPYSWGGVILGFAIASWLYHMGFIVTGKVANMVKNAEVETAKFKTEAEALRKEMENVRMELEEWRAFKKKRLDLALGE